MTDFERNYRTGRSVCGIVSIFGWCVATLGFVVAGVALVSLVRSGDMLSAMTQIMAIAVGFGVALGGLVGVAAAQHMEAAFDVADISREMLELSRRRPASPGPARVGSAASGPGTPPAFDGQGRAAPIASAVDPGISERPVPSPTDGMPLSGPKLSAPARTKGPGTKVHPIFSARPPR